MTFSPLSWDYKVGSLKNEILYSIIQYLCKWVSFSLVTFYIRRLVCSLFKLKVLLKNQEEKVGFFFQVLITAQVKFWPLLLASFHSFGKGILLQKDLPALLLIAANFCIVKQWAEKNPPTIKAWFRMIQEGYVWCKTKGSQNPVPLGIIVTSESLSHLSDQKASR